MIRGWFIKIKQWWKRLLNRIRQRKSRRTVRWEEDYMYRHGKAYRRMIVESRIRKARKAKVKKRRKAARAMHQKLRRRG